MPISIGRDAAEAQAALARSAKDEELAARRERTKKLRERAKEEAQAGEFAGQEPEAEVEADDDNTEPAEPCEEVEYVELKLPRGQVVEFGPPTDVALAVKIMRFGRNLSQYEETLTRILMCVRSIDGRRVDVKDAISRDKVLNEIGDRGLEHLVRAYSRFWMPNPLADELQIIKKVSR